MNQNELRTDRCKLRSAMDAAPFSQLLLKLYRAAGTTSIKSFREFVLREVQSCLPFDGVMWTSTGVAGHRPFRYVWVLGGVSAEMLQLFERHADDDGGFEFFRGVLDEPQVVRPEDTFPGSLMAAISAYAGMREVMMMAQRNEDLDRFSVLAFGRHAGRAPFDADERALMRMLVPHLEAMVLQNFEGQITAAMVQRMAGEVGLAVVAGRSLVLEEERFTQLMRKAWPDWKGAQLPGPMLQALNAGRSFLPCRGAGFHFVPSDGLVLVLATPGSALHTLTRKEFAIASAFAHGQSYKEVARSHGLSPATVRSRLRAVYEKLSIGGKTELSRHFAQTQLIEDLHDLF